MNLFLKLLINHLNTIDGQRDSAESLKKILLKQQLENLTDTLEVEEKAHKKVAH